MSKKANPLPKDMVTYDLSDLENDNITEEIEKTLSSMRDAPPKKVEPKAPPKGARWSYWT